MANNDLKLSLLLIYLLPPELLQLIIMMAMLVSRLEVPSKLTSLTIPDIFYTGDAQALK